MLESFHDGRDQHVNLNIKLKNANVEQRTLRWPGYASENVLKIEFEDHSGTINSMALATCLPVIFAVSALDNLNIKNGINHPNNLFTKKYVDQILHFITKFNVKIEEMKLDH
ncbi:hypothetical protein [Bartonella sp. TP]|uniref:hypothetical protein n=1 Tax=Bartonella sp. TP TaxID=3057550 RepID=UPI0025B226B5|nr:hypothetical protein [Bartonella sp. TP]WJW80028.1 hypothetical protein QVL57_00215 [Bartonella sp. TP]